MVRPVTPNLSLLARPSGAFAMVAIDQRESLRLMLAEGASAPVSDAAITDFKLAVIRAVTPYASAILLDRPFAWRPALDAGAVYPDCALIVAADDIHAAGDELIGEVTLDPLVVPAEMRADGAAAMKLLVLWRPDQPAEARLALVDDFIERCRAMGLLSVIEPVSHKPRDGRAWDLEDGILAAAQELGNRGADLYKAEVPLHGAGSEAEVRAACAALSRTIASPWVVLSSGVTAERFPLAVHWACQEGASGFLAGRGIWRGVIGRPDREAALREDAIPRMQRLCEIVDRVCGR
jgi:sulfofructosephosphate aldolase